MKTRPRYHQSFVFYLQVLLICPSPTIEVHGSDIDNDDRFGSGQSGCCSGSASGSGLQELSELRDQSGSRSDADGRRRHATATLTVHEEQCTGLRRWKSVLILQLEERAETECLEPILRDSSLTRQLVHESLREWSGEERGMETTAPNDSCVSFKHCQRATSISNQTWLFEKTKVLLRKVEQCAANTVKQLVVLLLNDTKARHAGCLTKAAPHVDSSLNASYCVNSTSRTCEDGDQTLPRNKCLQAIEGMSFLINKTTTGTFPGYESDEIIMLRRLTEHTSAKLENLAQLELQGVGQVRAKCEVLTFKNCSSLFASAQSALSSSRRALIALSVTLTTLTNIRTLGSLIVWGLRASSPTNHSSHGQRMHSLGKTVGGDLLQELCKQVHACNEESASSSAADLCQKARLSVVDSQDLITKETRASLMNPIELICAKNDMNATNGEPTSSTRGSLSHHRYQHYCQPVRNCPEPYFIQTNSPALATVSFSPDETYQKYLIDLFNRSGMTTSNSTLPKQCQLRCRPEISGAETLIYYTIWASGAFLFFLSTTVAVFGVVLVCFNRERMLEEPRRSFLFYNIATIYNRLGMLGFLFPREYVWCNADGSFVVNSEAGLLCNSSVWMISVSTLCLPLALFWLCFGWYKTLQKLSDVRRVVPPNVWTQRSFIAVFLLAPWSAVGFNFRSPQRLEGAPLYSSCLLYTEGREHIPPERIVVYAVSRASFILAAVFFFKSSKLFLKLKNQSQLFRPHPALETWRRRHRWFFIFGLINLLPVLFNVLSILVEMTPLRAEPVGYREDTFQEVGRCFELSGCNRENSCRLPGRGFAFHVRAFLIMCFFDGCLCVLGFGWCLFREVKWPVMKKVKAWIDSKFGL